MASNEGMLRIEPSSPAYQEVARLYRIAQDLHPGGLDRWNGELYARFDDKWGGLSRDGTLRLNQDLVLRQLTGGRLSDRPDLQAQALATVLHESRHARAEFDAPNEPNALRQPRSVDLDEGLVELSTMEDFATFAQQAGYDAVPQPTPEYPGAVHAADALLDRASGPAGRTQTLTELIDQPVMMRWDAVADRLVQNELADVVPPDPAHQQAARAHLVNKMAVESWEGLRDRPDGGSTVAALTNAGLDEGVQDLREHYRSSPETPHPARSPNPHAQAAVKTEHSPEQARVGARGQEQTVDLSKLPPPDAATRVDSPGQQTGDMRFLSGQAPAAQATRHAPVLGDGARGAGAPQVAGVGRRVPGERGRD
ncbi:hypothetical protein AB0P21_36310 [Kribbella sp. NPDC056861]|uniref:hypothetical protein n=1 Tax=Kribbella sp. NPDC056861 TaxID=3154857 RepID=UPI0034348425